MDWQLHVGDLILLALTGFLTPAIWKFGTAIFSMRDTLKGLQEEMRQFKLVLGKPAPPEGALGDIDQLKKEARRQRDWLIEAGIVHPSDRT